jgi:hypothetical protein
MCQLLLLVLVGLFSQPGCNCPQDIGEGNQPMDIDILEPSGTRIAVGRVRFRVRDANGIDKIQFLINNKVVQELDAAEKEEYVKTVTFNYDLQPKVFKVTVKATDTLGAEKEKSITFTKETGGPVLIFKAPVKLKTDHPAIFIGKKTEVKVEAKDANGVREIILSMGTKADSAVKVRTCTGTQKANAVDPCVAQVDLSDGKYKSGPFTFFADAKDVNDNTSDQKALRVILDKDGPQIKILTPSAGQQLTGQQIFRAVVVDQVGVKRVEFTLGGKSIPGVQVDSNRANNYIATVDASKFGSGGGTFKVVAYDELGNPSEATVQLKLGCQTDADCAAKPGTRCCPSEGVCYPTVNQDGAICDPCKKPCGRGSNGKLMGCVPGVCGKQLGKPNRCRAACNLGNANQRPDPCRPKDNSTGRPAEYCTQSPSGLGACAIGDSCDPFNQRTCPPGAKPPFNGCCPQGFGCFPADDDANICIPEGKKPIGGKNCTSLNCTNPADNCARGSTCIVDVNPNTGQATGPPYCSKLCKTRKDPMTGKYTAVMSAPECNGKPCVPLQLTRGKVPLPVGACLLCVPRGGACKSTADCCSGARCTIGICF